MKVRKLTLMKQIEKDIEDNKYTEGWFFLSDGKPAKIDWDNGTTYSPEEDKVQAFKYGTTLYTRYQGEQIVWNELEFWECGEEWTNRRREVQVVDNVEQSVVITIMERKQVEFQEFGDYQSPFQSREEQKDVEMETREPAKGSEKSDEEPFPELVKEKEKQGEQEKSSEPEKSSEEMETERRKVAERLPSIGEDLGETMVIAGVELDSESTLKKLRTACEFLKIGKTGSTAQVWRRLKEAVASNWSRFPKDWNSSLRESRKERSSQKNQVKRRERDTN